ncbi:TolC family protein [Sediminicola luteus]|uniref:Transporter n=1 Tax=Sediminicola luteus TaxID=319238 RepID=A0A2A4G4X9_9FLAO|nr:TolC family protein [Sediminicola luteus]PCE63040.1 hypothetical protein B7P33_17355 [Sediminicola luteus]
MKTKYVFACCGYFFAMGLFGQSPGLQEVLRSIEQNNTGLQALASQMEGESLALKSENNLPDPEITGYYLPWGNHSTGNYSEVELSQSMDFPTVYGKRGQWIEQQKNLLGLHYALERQNILLKAQKTYIELSILDRKIGHESERYKQAKTVYEQLSKSFEAGEAGILDFNKAKLVWMGKRFVLDQLEQQRQSQLAKLQWLNGDLPLKLEAVSMPPMAALPQFETLWVNKLQNDPELLIPQGKEDLAQRSIALAKAKSLPKLSLGYNYQGVQGENHSGLLGGLSIPLWNSKNKVKSEKMKWESQKVTTQHNESNLKLTAQTAYDRYMVLYTKWEAYTESLLSLNSEALLLKAYALGELSYLQYHQEIQFYQQAQEKQLQMEKELHLTRAQLLKHQL